MILLLLPILLPIAGGYFVFRQKNERIRNRLALATAAATAALALWVCFLPVQSMDLMTIQGSMRLSLENDGLSRFFMALIACIWVPVTVFSFSYLRHAGRERQFLGFHTMSLGILMGLSMAKNFVTLYMFFEMMSLITMPLVLHDGTSVSRKAAFKYLGYSVFGAGLALGGFVLLYGFTISPDFASGGVLDPAGAGAHRPLLLIAYFLMILGFGAKAGLMPLQAWLPAAHPVAPAPASALLSGVITKGGVLAIIRVTYYMFGSEFLLGSWAVKTLSILALCTIFAGSMLAMREKQLKTRLAYSTVSQVSYVLFGLLLLTPGGVAGALMQIVFHAFAKNTLFLAAGAMILSTHRTRADELTGIGRRMPVTTLCFAAASLSLIGIPPLGGFISKWNLATASLYSASGALGLAGVSVLILSALLTAAYLLPIVTRGFFPGRDFEAERGEAGPGMTGPMIAFSLICVILGLFPGGLIDWFNRLVVQIF